MNLLTNFRKKFMQTIYQNILKKDVLSEINNNLILENLFPKKNGHSGLINNEEELKRLSIKVRKKKILKTGIDHTVTIIIINF